MSNGSRLTLFGVFEKHRPTSRIWRVWARTANAARKIVAYVIPRNAPEVFVEAIPDPGKAGVKP